MAMLTGAPAAAFIGLLALTGCVPGGPFERNCILGGAVCQSLTRPPGANPREQLASCDQRSRTTCYVDTYGRVVPLAPTYQQANADCEDTRASSVVLQGVTFACYRDQLARTYAYRPGIDQPPPPPSPASALAKIIPSLGK